MIRSASLLVMTGALWAGAAHAQMSGADLVTRIDRLQAQVRELTGTVEELQYRNQQLEQEVQRLRAAAPGPAAAPSAAQSSPPPSPRYSSQYPPAAGAYPPAAPQSAAAVASVPVAAPPPALPANDAGFAGARHGDAFDPDRNPTAPGAPRPLGASTEANEPPPPPVASVAMPAAPARAPGAPLDLSSPSVSPPASAAAPPGGDLPPPANTNSTGATGAMQAALPPGNTPKDEYDLAYGYVQHKDFALAQQTFRDFLHKYPGDRLAPEAQYWLGESLFQDKQYRDAAESFLTVSTKFENTARAPDALLRLGQSLAALGEKEAACASLGEVLRKYPRAPLSVKQSVDREQKRTHC
jgi:tol-pal system protein YbgF